MSYRKAWRAVKRDFPEVHCVLMVGGFRIAKDRTREAEMEFYSLGNGYTRKQAWEDAAKTCACPVFRERHNLIRQFKLVDLA
jgi:hypothetical protein